MDLRKNVEIGIGSAGAKRGAGAIRRALDSIKRKSREVHNQGARDAKKHSRALGLVAKATAAISGFVIARSAIKSQIDFGQAVADLSAITGAVGEDLEFLRQKSKEFGETTTLSASQAAEAFKVIASAKPDLLENVEALSLVTEEAIALAEATGESLPSAANAMAASLNQFGEGAESASRFINVLAAGSKRGAALVGEMAEALKFSGIIASQAGLSFEETNAALQLMSTRALKGSEAGTQFRGVLLSLTAQSKDEFKPEVVGLSAALENLAAAGLDEGSAALRLFGRRNLAAAKTLIQNRDALGTLTDQLTGTNIAYEQQAIRVDNLSGDIKALKSAYEGLELTVGERLNGALRAMTQSATESIRELSKNPLLQERTTKVLDTIHRALEDIGIAFDQITAAVTKAGGGAAVFESVWGQAIDNIVMAVKFLWEQFVIGGPANLKLGFTLMIAAADRFKIALVEKIRVATFLVIQSFIAMASKISSVFDQIKIFINKVIDDIIISVRNKLLGIANAVESLGFDEKAEQIRDMANAFATFANNEAEAREEAEKSKAARDAQIMVLDELIKETEDAAEVQKQASRDAVEGAIAERDATLETIKALRTKREEITDGQAAALGNSAGPGGTSLADPATAAKDAYEDLGDTQKRIVDDMSQGISDMAAKGKLDFKSLALSIIQDLIRIQLQTQLTNIFSQFLANLGAGTATGGVGAGGASFVPPSGTIDAARGITAKVGGSGGTDSQRIVINATPGEIIQVRTPEQQRNMERGSSDTKVEFVVNNFTDSKVNATQTQDVDGNVLIQASIVAVSRNISRNGEVFQALQSRNRLQRR